ncbi:MmgE/PrpD family protein [Streptosporangiaceae bacterium NEAU-GS5]|nr:MmgE/PrpD family protein [Streptosporangiaceae bacterium NEAU-GS5]
MNNETTGNNGDKGASLTEELSAWAGALRFDDIPARVVALAKSQVLSQITAIRAGAGLPLGRSLIRAFGPPLQPDPRGSARVLAGLGSWLNLDDTAYAGHLSNSTVTVPLAYGRALGLDGARLLTAIVAANECAARVTAAATLGPFRGQTAAHTSLVGAVAGRMHAEGLPAHAWVEALGLALSMPPWTLARAYVGSDARVLGAYLPVAMAMDACDAQAAGMAGAADILEHPAGFLAQFATVPLPESVVAGLGRRWHTETLSFKVRPCGPGIDAAVDCAVELHRALGGPRMAEVREVVVSASAYTVAVHGIVADYENGPDTVVGALPLSLPYTVATALLSGGLSVADFTAPAVRDRERWALAAKVRVRHDGRMTRDLLRGEAPFGEAIRQAGDRARPWLDRLGVAGVVPIAGPAPTFERATKHTGARVELRMADGSKFSRGRSIPLGGAGPHTRSHHRALVVRKFVDGGGDRGIAGRFAELDRLSGPEVAGLLERCLTEVEGS